MSNYIATDPQEGGKEGAYERSQGGVLWETAALGVACLALFLTVCLLVPVGSGRYIGNVGTIVSLALRLVFGSIVAFAVPGFLLWTAILLFLGRRTRWSFSRLLGVFLLLPCIAGLLALPNADDPEYKAETFRRAGVLGSYMVEWDGLRLVGAFGTVGAAMILLSGALVGLVLITQVPVSAMAMMVARPFMNLSGPGETPHADPLPREGRARHTAATLFPDDDAEPEPETEPRTGFFRSLFRRGHGAALAEPSTEEQEESAFMDSFDEDALAAVRAIEEARIDEEYERALIEEEEARRRAEQRSIDDDLEAEIRAEQDIVFSDVTRQPIEIVSGNPRNEDEMDWEERAKLDVADELAKMFPSRWKKDGETVVRRAKQDQEDEKIRNKAEERAMRRIRSHAEDEDDELYFDEEETEENISGEDDPLFDENLETRPRGVHGALQENGVSALERDAAIARRDHLLSGYRLPEIELLDDPPKVDNRMSREEMLETSQALERTFADFNIQAKVVEVKQGPVVTRYELKPAAGVKVSRIVSLEHDIALAMRAVSVRIVAPIPGKAAVGIEVPNKNRAGVYFRELVGCREFWEHPSPLAFALGKTIDGQPYFADLKKMPHLLIAGATGAGKSVCLNTIICSLLYRQRPDRLRLIMVDPKRVELSIYQDIPHLISPVVCEPKRAAAALEWAVEQMEERYKQLVAVNVRNIDGFNAIATNPEKQGKLRGKTIEPMPHLVVVVDELADLMVIAKNEVEESIQRLAQMARAVGIHLILATQRPSVNVITGIIKANFPTRIAFQVSQKVDSRTILDSNGAEALLGRGDMLFAPAGAQKPIRLQGAFLSDEEVERVAEFTRMQLDGPLYEVDEFEPQLSEKEQRELARMMGNPGNMDDLDMHDRMARGTNRTMGKVNAGIFVPHDGGSANAGEEEIDEALVRAAARVILEGRKGSTSLIQRRLKVGFARAGRLMDMLEEMGIVGPYKGSKPRDILIDPDAALDQLAALENQISKTGGDSKRAAAQLDGLAG